MVYSLLMSSILTVAEGTVAVLGIVLAAAYGAALWHASRARRNTSPV